MRSQAERSFPLPLMAPWGTIFGQITPAVVEAFLGPFWRLGDTITGIVKTGLEPAAFDFSERGTARRQFLPIVVHSSAGF